MRGCSTADRRSRTGHGAQESGVSPRVRLPSSAAVCGSMAAWQHLRLALTSSLHPASAPFARGLCYRRCWIIEQASQQTQSPSSPIPRCRTAIRERCSCCSRARTELWHKSPAAAPRSRSPGTSSCRRCKVSSGVAPAPRTVAQHLRLRVGFAVQATFLPCLRHGRDRLPARGLSGRCVGSRCVRVFHRICRLMGKVGPPRLSYSASPRALHRLWRPRCSTTL